MLNVKSTWRLLDGPGLPLRNIQNKCWYHSTLHLLTAIPLIRDVCSAGSRKSSFEKSLTDALSAIFRSQSAEPVETLFWLVMDFSGRNNRYGQVAVPDFIEHLALQAPIIFSKIKSQVVTQLRCSQCRWVSHSDSSDILFKL